MSEQLKESQRVLEEVLKDRKVLENTSKELKNDKGFICYESFTKKWKCTFICM